MRRFTLRKEHIELLRHVYVEWQDCETGAPAIDPKRPYGNSDVANDVARILSLEDLSGREGDENRREQLLTLHRETATALEVVLRTGSFEPGLYMTTTSYSSDWRRAS